MDFEKYTERAKGFVQAAQMLAQRRGHQQITPDHLLKTLIDDKEGLCSNLIRAAGGEPKSVSAAVDAALDKLPRVEGGSGQVYLSAELNRLFAEAEKVAEKAGDSFVTVERLLLAMTLDRKIVLWVVSAPMRSWLNSSTMYCSSVCRLTSMRRPGLMARRLSMGTRL